MGHTHLPAEVAEAMSRGHGFKHVERGEFGEDGRRGPDTGVRTRADYAEHISATMTAADTRCFTTQHRHDIYYNAGTNTLVAYDPDRPDLGTCFRPTGKDRKFEQEFQKDVLHGGSPDRGRIVTGGYQALQVRKEQQQQDDFEKFKENRKRQLQEARREPKDRDKGFEMD